MPNYVTLFHVIDLSFMKGNAKIKIFHIFKEMIPNDAKFLLITMATTAISTLDPAGSNNDAMTIGSLC